MARAMWKGSIAFGLVNIPVELHSAVLKGRKPKLKERETPHQAEVVDLMARLRASLERKDERPRPERGAKSPSESERGPQRGTRVGVLERGWGPASTEKRKQGGARGRAADAGRQRRAEKGKRIA